MLRAFQYSALTRLLDTADTVSLYRKLQFLGRSERHFFTRFDLNRFAGCRIAPHPSRSLPDLQNAETCNSDAFPLSEMLGNKAYQVIEQRLAISFCELVLFGQASRKMLESDWTAGFCQRRRFCLSCHDFSL